LVERRAGDEDPRATLSDRWLNDRGLLIDDGALEVARAAYRLFMPKNNSWPPVLRMEHDLVEIALDLFHGSADAAGSITTGGSESLFLAIAAALAHARERRNGGPSNPEVLLADTGYPAAEKFARYLGYRVRRVATDTSFAADPDAIAAAIGPDTVMLIGSHPSWPHGVCDPIPDLARLAVERALWLHVDACVGGFLAPFLVELGQPLPAFDFSVPGVASISADFHKYGYSPKGVSGVFFRDRRLAANQTFTFDDWAAGLYRSPVFTGTRSGGAIAAAWAVARYLGRDGYRRRAAQVARARQAIVELVEAEPGLRLLGRPHLGTVAIGGEIIEAVADRFLACGWTAGRLQRPAGLQLVLGPFRDEIIDLLTADLRAAVADGGGPRGPTNAIYSDEILDVPGSLSYREAVA
jgi:glutamate/tyrosine decarboxylase-like PLP-dependent enzyme